MTIQGDAAASTERERIVAWLRNYEEKFHSQSPLRSLLGLVGNCIMHEEHWGDWGKEYPTGKRVTVNPSGEDNLTVPPLGGLIRPMEDEDD